MNCKTRRSAFAKSMRNTCLGLNFIDVSVEAVHLRDGYLQAGVVTPKWATDALHVALASAGHCRCIVSWNFKDIVHFDKIPLYNGVNLINGFDTISINTPAEVIAYET